MDSTERRVSRPGLMIYHNDYLSIRDLLTDEQRGKLFDSLILFSLSIADKSIPVEQVSEIMPELETDDLTIKLCFNLLSEKVKRDSVAFRKRCEQNSRNRKAGIEKKEQGEKQP